MLTDKLHPDFAEGVAVLEQTRLAVAAKNRDLALRELEARTLRLAIEIRLRSGTTETVPVPKTDAERFAKGDAEYVAYEQQTAQIAYERDVLWAKAEAIRLELQGYIQLQEVAA